MLTGNGNSYGSFFCVHLLTSTARWLHDGDVDDDDDAQIGPVVTFGNLLLLNNMLCIKENSKNLEQLLTECVFGRHAL
jgi:hypothetical protein